MFAGVFTTIIAFILLLNWFPVVMPLSWIVFVVCFIISRTVSTLISELAEKQKIADFKRL